MPIHTTKKKNASLLNKYTYIAFIHTQMGTLTFCLTKNWIKFTGIYSVFKHVLKSLIKLSVSFAWY